MRQKRIATAKRPGKSREVLRKVVITVAILLLAGGAGVMIYPRVQQVLYSRYAEALITAWEDRLDDYRAFIQQRWVNERTALWSAVSDLTVAHNDDLYVGPSGNIYNGSFSIGPGGSVSDGGFYIGPSGNMYVSNLTIYSNGEPFTIGPGGVLSVGGSAVGEDGSISIGNLSMATGGYFYINGDSGSLYHNGSGGNLSISNLSLNTNGTEFALYLGDVHLGDIAIDYNGDFDEYFDLDFIFNFDLNQDPMYWLYQRMADYNFDLYETEQENLVDLESAEEVDFSVTETAGFSEEMLGFITIEVLNNLRLPIFAGSSDANMLRGAAHMSHTSLPVGGPSTNSVITAHRGLSRARMFRDIGDLENGDIILITNFYQTLRYAVVGYEIIDPVISDLDPILIREGVDMITLLTCHPYRHDTQRLLVFAERLPD